MATNTVNPYSSLRKEITEGMDAIAANLTPDSSIDDLVNEVYAFIQPIFYPLPKVPRQLEIEIKSVSYNIINAYNNNAIKTGAVEYNQAQSNLIDMMLGLQTTNYTPVEALGQWLLDIEDNISKADLTIEEQTPLLLGIEAGIALNDYWTTKVATPGDWGKFFLPQAAAAANLASIPLWTCAGMDGALIGADTGEDGLIAPNIDIISTNIISSLIGVLTIGAGKVIFKWVPRIQPINVVPTLTLEKSVVSRLNDSGLFSASLRGPRRSHRKGGDCRFSRKHYTQCGEGERISVSGKCCPAG